MSSSQAQDAQLSNEKPSRAPGRVWEICPLSSCRVEPKLASIAPAQSSPPLSSALQSWTDQLSFAEAFGVLGFPMVLVALICIAWTAWLIFLTEAPTWTVNYPMNTEQLGGGEFWFIVDSEPWMKALSLSELIFVALGYVIVKMVIWRNHITSNMSESFLSRMNSWTIVRKRGAVCLPSKRRPRWVLLEWQDLTGFYGRKRKFWSLWLKTVDLTFQTIALVLILESEFPKVLNYSHAALLAANTCSCVAMTLCGHRHSTLMEVLIDSIFDSLFAVVAPITVLAYNYSNFYFGHGVLKINTEVYSPGSFERIARLIANPSEISLFRTSFNSLRIQLVTDFVLRIGMNFSICNRFKRAVEVQIARRKRAMMHQRQRSHTATVVASQLHVPRLAALPFTIFGFWWSSPPTNPLRSRLRRVQCTPDAWCTHRWDTGQVCPCLILINTEKEPETWDEWADPVDEAETVRQLAKSGDLRVLQSIN